MSDDMPETAKQNKEKVNASVNRWVKSEFDKLGSDLGYGGKSNAIETALVFYLGTLERDRELQIARLETELKAVNEELKITTANYEAKLKLTEAELKKVSGKLFAIVVNRSEFANDIRDDDEK